MGVEAVLILGRRIDEVVAHPNHRREFEPVGWVEIGVADAAIDRAVSEAQIGEAGGIVVADRDVACPIDHVVVDALVPLQRRLRE